MNERDATAKASEVGGEAWHSGGGLWLVLIDLLGGSVRVISDDADCVYSSRAAFHAGAEPTADPLVPG